ncbi:MAG TPA: hypothetical protein VFG42_11565 [Baekduia sp.]|uniref:hypothetical protein n=1 Tax=Baekduia sp. TaxID=2600305 RepID=UPI002D776497|nr:hypothetical protein [Baekduia sp.]HET6507416.1 hypothetical protein [Baekduia sp.]
MPADRHDFPALDRLTADVAQAMRAAEAADAAPRARWWRRTPPLAVTLLALAVPSAVALHATTGKGQERGVHVFRCDGGTTVGAAAVLLTGVASVGRCSATPQRGRIVYRCALPGTPGLSRTAGSRAAAPVRRPCA